MMPVLGAPHSGGTGYAFCSCACIRSRLLTRCMGPLLAPNRSTGASAMAAGLGGRPDQDSTSVMRQRFGTLAKVADIGPNFHRANSRSSSLSEELLYPARELSKRRLIWQKNVVPTLKGHKLGIGNRRGNE